MKNKKLIIFLVILIVVLLVVGGIIFLKNKEKAKKDNDGLPYIYIKGHEQKVKAIRYEGYKEIYDALYLGGDKFYSVSDFYDIWELNVDNFLQYDTDGVVYFDVYSSDGSEFSVDGIMRLECRKDYVCMRYGGGMKETMIGDKESGNPRRIGFSNPRTFETQEYDTIKVLKINFKEYGIHYYSVVDNKSEE